MTDFLMLAFIFLAAGVISVPIASRLGLGSVLGYLIAGIVISPILALLGVDVVSIQHFAEFGVVMMLFLVGLELEPKHLWGMRHQLLGLGGGQIGLTALAVMGMAMMLNLPWEQSLAVGLVLALSSTAIVLQTLNEKGLMKSPGGQSGFSVLLTQDIAVIPILALVPLLALPGAVDERGMPPNVGNAEIIQMDDHAPRNVTTDHATESVGQGDDAHGETAHGDAAHGDDHDSGMSLVDGLNGWQTALVTAAAIALLSSLAETS